jgi:hypothetical protein
MSRPATRRTRRAPEEEGGSRPRPNRIGQAPNGTTTLPRERICRFVLSSANSTSTIVRVLDLVGCLIPCHRTNRATVEQPIVSAGTPARLGYAAGGSTQRRDSTVTPRKLQAPFPPPFQSNSPRSRPPHEAPSRPRPQRKLHRSVWKDRWYIPQIARVASRKIPVAKIKNAKSCQKRLGLQAAAQAATIRRHYARTLPVAAAVWDSFRRCHIGQCSEEPL